jgi:hypothetical protein
VPPTVVKYVVPEVVSVTPDLLRAASAKIPDILSPITKSVAPKASCPVALAEARVDVVPGIEPVVPEVVNAGKIVVLPEVPLGPTIGCDVLPVVGTDWSLRANGLTGSQIWIELPATPGTP